MPTPTTRTVNYTYGRGEVSLARFQTGTKSPAGFRYIGNTPAFGFTTQTQELDHFGSDHGVGELDFSIQTQVTRSGSLTTDDIQLDNLALQFLGSKATVTQTSATEISETFADVIFGLEYQLGMTPGRPMGVRNVTNVVVKVASATKTLGTDYTVDMPRGLVRVTEGGSIVSGVDDIVVTYDTIASSYDQVISGNNAIEGAIMFKADNPSGQNLDIFLPWVRITPNGEFALKAENALQQLQFSLKVLKISGQAACYINGQPYTGA